MLIFFSSLLQWWDRQITQVCVALCLQMREVHEYVLLMRLLSYGDPGIQSWGWNKNGHFSHVLQFVEIVNWCVLSESARHVIWENSCLQKTVFSQKLFYFFLLDLLGCPEPYCSIAKLLMKIMWSLKKKEITIKSALLLASSCIVYPFYR